MGKRHTQRRKPRDTTRAVPYLYRDDASGICQTVHMLRYFQEPTGASVTRALYRTPRTTLATILADVDTLLSVEKHRAEFTVPAQLVPREPIAVAPIPAEPYRPRVIRHDADGYEPQTSYSRAELVALLVRSARQA